MPLKLFKKNNKKINFKFFDGESLKQAQRRILFSASLIILIYICVLIRLTDLMVISNLFLEEDKNIIENEILIQAERGDIYDRNGNLLATTIRSYSLAARPKLIKNKHKTAKELKKIINYSEEKILKKITSNASFVWIKRDITPRENFRINSIGEVGLQIIKEKKRIYPYGSLASHIIGFTDIDESPLSGIEKGLNEKLKNNEDIYLSIDVNLQHIVFEELKNAINKFDADGGTSIIVDILSGQVLAASSMPNFDPNNINLYPKKNLFNSFSQGVYEMGSTFKPITMAIGYDSNIINDNDLFEVNKPINVDKHTINDFYELEGPLTVKEIIVNSSNIGTAKIAEKIGKKIQKNYLEKFGLLERQILEIPETATPLFPKPWLPVNTMTIGYGYGISISPIQLCSVYSTLVNGGIPVKTTLLKNSEKEYYSRVIKEETSYKIRELLKAVILETKWTGPRAKVVGYEVGGKTGTAELIENSSYHKKANLSSFIGVFPISNPKYVILTMIKNPKGIEETHYITTGAWVAAPVVANIIKRMVKVLSIPPKEKEYIYNADFDKNNLKGNNIAIN